MKVMTLFSRSVWKKKTGQGRAIKFAKKKSVILFSPSNARRVYSLALFFKCAKDQLLTSRLGNLLRQRH